MISQRKLRPLLGALPLAVAVVLALTNCTKRTTSMNQSELTDFATRYAAAWSSQNPASLAAFYAGGGSLTVNAGASSVGRAAVTAKAQGFMTAFPDMVVKLDEIHGDSRHAIFRWIWTGTNTGPGARANPSGSGDTRNGL
jgi:SnoaL-like domain